MKMADMDYLYQKMADMKIADKTDGRYEDCR